jgi:hypothetical protein
LKFIFPNVLTAIDAERAGVALAASAHYVPREPFAFLSMNDGLSDKF